MSNNIVGVRISKNRKMGVVVKNTADKFQVFAYNQKILSFPKNLATKCETSVGSWIDWDEKTLQCRNRKPKFHCEAVDGVLHVNTAACCANPLLLARENRDKWENIVWSPFIGLIHDPTDEFLPITANELHDVTVKFVGSKDCTWEVVKAGLPVTDSALQNSCAYAPWNLAQIEVEVEATSKRDAFDENVDQNDVDEKARYCGVVAWRDADCSWLWGHSTGFLKVFQWCDVGQWYSFEMKRKRHADRMRAFTLASNLKKIEARAKTFVDKYGLVVATEMLYDEKVSNTKEYFDYNLGKVSISSELLSIIENKKRQFEKLKIQGTARILRKTRVFAETAWTLKSINKIVFPNGKVIEL